MSGGENTHQVGGKCILLSLAVVAALIPAESKADHVGTPKIFATGADRNCIGDTSFSGEATTLVNKCASPLEFRWSTLENPSPAQYSTLVVPGHSTFRTQGLVRVVAACNLGQRFDPSSAGCVPYSGNIASGSRVVGSQLARTNGASIDVAQPSRGEIEEPTDDVDLADLESSDTGASTGQMMAAILGIAAGGDPHAVVSATMGPRAAMSLRTPQVEAALAASHATGSERTLTRDNCHTVPFGCQQLGASRKAMPNQVASNRGGRGPRIGCVAVVANQYGSRGLQNRCMDPLDVSWRTASGSWASWSIGPNAWSSVGGDAVFIAACDKGTFYREKEGLCR